MQWVLLKDWLAAFTGLSEDALHIYAALAVQFAAAFLFRRRIGDVLPLVIVALVLLVNEYLDITLPGHPIEQWQVDGGVRDLWNTMLLPTLLFLLARAAPDVFDRTRKSGKATPQADSVN